MTGAKEEELIEKTAQTISKKNIELPLLLIGAGLVPVSTTSAYIALLPMAPFLETFTLNGCESIALFKKITKCSTPSEENRGTDGVEGKAWSARYIMSSSAWIQYSIYTDICIDREYEEQLTETVDSGLKRRKTEAV